MAIWRSTGHFREQLENSLYSQVRDKGLGLNAQVLRVERRGWILNKR